MTYTTTGTNHYSDAEWVTVLVHRSPREIPDVADRFERVGVSPDTVAKVLSDLGDHLINCFPDDWPPEYGGLDGVALLSAEVESYAGHAADRASRARGAIFNRLIRDSDDSLSAIAHRLGISKQTLHRAAKRPGALTDFARYLTEGPLS